MDVNFYGYLYVTHFAYPLLSHSKGNLIAITSFSGPSSPNIALSPMSISSHGVVDG
jgi:NADP-dependent 3-hydroxy acid dehydrogenase YdfG